MISMDSHGDQRMSELGSSRREWVFNLLGLVVLLGLLVV